MNAICRMAAAGVMAAMAMSPVLAQEGVGSGGRRPGAMADLGRMRGSMTDAVAGVATNPAVAKAIGLTDEQVTSLKAKLNADKMRTALAAARLAEALTTLLSDAQIATDLGLTEAQRAAVKNVSPDLLKQALSPKEIEELDRALAGGILADGAMRAFGDRLKQFDKDGDGQLSEQEREAARNAWRQQRGEQQGGDQQRTLQQPEAQPAATPQAK